MRSGRVKDHRGMLAAVRGTVRGTLAAVTLAAVLAFTGAGCTTATDCRTSPGTGRTVCTETRGPAGNPAAWIGAGLIVAAVAAGGIRTRRDPDQ